MRFIADFFHEIFESVTEKCFDCSFSKFWGAEIFVGLQNDPRHWGRSKKGKKYEKSKTK